MKVALIHYRLVNLGGLETRIMNYVSYFHEQGHEVTVIYAKKASQTILPVGVKEIKIELGLVPKVFRTWYFDRKLKAVMQEQDFDFSLGLGRTSHQTAVLAPGTHRGYLGRMGMRHRWLGLKDRVQIGLEKKAYQNSAVILACSEMIREELIRLYGIPVEKIKVLYPPLNTDLYYPSKGKDQVELKQKLGFDSSKASFLFVSTSHPRKGLSLLLRLFAELPAEKYELGIVGRPYRKAMPENVQYLGRFTDLRELYLAADYTIHPAVYEPLGQVISESLQCQTPVLISDRVGAQEILDENSGLVLDSLDTLVWKEAVLSLAKRNLRVSPEILKGKGIYLAEHMEQMLRAWQQSLTML